jgi:diguanylate cyclase (GGDEF)-like protein
MDNRQEQPNILIVDDQIEYLNLLSEILTERDYQVRSATSGEMALTSARTTPPDLILLDINMPGLDGYQVCRQLKKEDRTKEIPVIFISANSESFNKVEAFTVGGVDYITKPFELNEILVRVQNQLNLQAARKQICQLNIELAEKIARLNQQLERKIIQKQKIERKLLEIALTDDLTKLPNRNWFVRRLEKEIEQKKINADYQFAVLLLDCKNFKTIDTSLGYVISDSILITIGKQLQDCLSNHHSLARLEGARFIIVLSKIKDLTEACSIAKQIHQNLNTFLTIKEREIYLDFNIGIVLANEEYDLPEQLLRNAELALDRAKSLDEPFYRVFTPEIYPLTLERFQLDVEIRKALQNREFILHYQPIFCLQKKSLIGFEALIRWQHPVKGIIEPMKFLPLIEETDSIVSIDNWVLQEGCNYVKKWHEQNFQDWNVSLDVNISKQQFYHRDFIKTIEQILERTKLSPKYLKLDITEDTIVEDIDAAHDICQQLNKRRIDVSIDNFGTSYSCLKYLDKFAMNNLKIDRSMVKTLVENEQFYQLIEAIIKFAHHLGITVTAQGIETEAQVKFFQDLGCQFGQGYFFSKPLEGKQI